MTFRVSLYIDLMAEVESPLGTVFWTNGYGQYSSEFFEQFDCRNDRIMESLDSLL